MTPVHVHDEADLERRKLISIAAMAPALALAGTSFPARARVGVGSADLSEELAAYHRATMNHDVATLAGLVSDDYMLVNSDSSVQDKASYLSDFELPGFRIDAYEPEQPMEKVWGDAALTTWLMRLGWTQDGRHQSRRLRVAHVWARPNDRWHIAYTQLTRVPEQAGL